MKKILTKLVATSVILISQISTVYAQLVIPKPDILPGPSTSSQKSTSELRAYFEENVFGNFTSFIISLAAITTFVFVVVSGIRMLVAYGDEEAYTSSKKMFFISLAGLGISLLSFTIVSIIARLQF